MKRESCGLLALGLMTLIVKVSAADIVVAPAVDLSYKNSDFTTEFSGGTVISLVKPTYTTLTPSLALSAGRFYGVLSHESTINEWDSTALRVGVGSNTIVFDTFERDESSVTAGYRLFEGGNRIGPVNIFVGFLQGVSAWRSMSINSNASNVLTVNTVNSDFSEKGFFFGANYTHSFGNKGALSLSAAYALLDGDLNEIKSGTSVANRDLLSESRGLSFGVAWSGVMTGSLNYRVGLKYINYKFDVTSIQDNITGTVTSVQSGENVIKESIYSLYFGVINYF